jgi:hypothetical protein
MKEGENICLKPERHMTVLTSVALWFKAQF